MERVMVLLAWVSPLRKTQMTKHLTEQLFHGDETHWKVFQVIEGKIGYRWYLWMIRSD